MRTSNPFRAVFYFSLLALAGCAERTGAPTAPQEISITSKSPQAVEHYKQGRELAENGRIATAMEEFNAPSDPLGQSDLHFARGVMALAGGDAKAATQEFAQCVKEDSYCHWQQAVAEQMARNATAAQATRQKLLRSYRRDPMYLYVWSKLKA